MLNTFVLISILLLLVGTYGVRQVWGVRAVKMLWRVVAIWFYTMALALCVSLAIAHGLQSMVGYAVLNVATMSAVLIAAIATKALVGADESA